MPGHQGEAGGTVPCGLQRECGPRHLAVSLVARRPWDQVSRSVALGYSRPGYWSRFSVVPEGLAGFTWELFLECSLGPGDAGAEGEHKEVLPLSA